jgi:hypothetical protein
MFWRQKSLVAVLIEDVGLENVILNEVNLCWLVLVFKNIKVLMDERFI